MTFFGLKSRQDLENWAAQLHQEFPEVHPLGLYYCGHTKYSRLPPARFGIQIQTWNFCCNYTGRENLLEKCFKNQEVWKLKLMFSQG